MSGRSHRIVIVGGGAGGAELAVHLARGGEKDVLLVDQRATHVWKPRLHEMAAGARRGSVDELDYAGLAERWGFAFEQGELADVRVDDKRVVLRSIENDQGDTVVPEREIGYEALTLATGGVTPDMGVDGVLEHALMLDWADDAETLYQRFSQGLLAGAVADEKQPFNVVIVGSGATGVELAAFLSTDHLCAAIAPRAKSPPVKVTVLEAVDTFMPGMNDTVRQAVTDRLHDANVETRTGQKVSRVTVDAVETEDDERFAADLTVWATGRVGPPVAGAIEALATNKKRQWIVRKSLQTPASDAIFALGDCAYIEDDPAPPTAQAASEQASHLGRELPRYLDGKRPADFSYKDKGTLLSLGEAGTVGATRGLFSNDVQIRGRLARAAYRGVQRQHQFTLLGPVKGSAEVLSNIFGRSVGPRLKVH